MMNPRRAILLLSPLLLVTTTFAQSTQSASDFMDFGTEGLSFPPAIPKIVHTPRTAELIGEAYRRKDPVVWQRVRYVADLGQVALPAASPYLADATKDPAAQVRAQAARSARMVNYAGLLPAIEQLLADTDPAVRREAVFASATLSKNHDQPTAAITKGLVDPSPSVVAAALESAWLPEHAEPIAQKLPTLPDDLKAVAAEALARLSATSQSQSLLPLLAADIPQKVAALRALAALRATAHADATIRLLSDPHPTVRREATFALLKLADPATRESRAIQMLADADPTVRQAAATVLTPLPSSSALAALLPQLDLDYAPLHQATRRSLITPATPAVRDEIIRAAASLLAHDNPRPREDGSYILGRLRSNSAIQAHVALLQWDTKDPLKSDWPLVGQAAESLGRIGDSSAIPPLMALVKPAPEAVTGSVDQRRHMSQAMANALTAAARLRHRPVLDEAGRIIALNPEGCPGNVRAASAFAVGVLSSPSQSPPHAGDLIPMYDSTYEDAATKFEALKALGNLRHAASANRLKTISESDPRRDIRWIAHWAYQRAASVTVHYTPPTELLDPPVTITDITPTQR